MSGIIILVWDNKLERRKKEKNIKEYNAINVTLCSRTAEIAITWCNRSIERP